MSSKLKVYELAKELNIDPQNLVETVQRLGIEIKNSMSILGTEEIRNIREHYRKNRVFSQTKPAPTVVSTKPSVSEKRVGSTVIRRRSAKTEPEVEASPPSAVVEPEALVQTSDSVAPEVEVKPVSNTPASEPVATKTVETTPSAPVGLKTPKREVEIPVAGPGPRPRRQITSIIKKVKTEEHLEQTVGPKIEKPKTKEEGTEAGSVLFKQRVKEVELVPADTAKEVARKKLLERQSTVFKSSDYLKREMVHSTKKKKAASSRPALKTQITTPAEHKRVVEMGETVSVSEFAKNMGVKATAVIAKLMNLGVEATINQAIDFDTASLVAPEFSFEIKQKVFKEEAYVPQIDLSSDKLSPRPPVVTIMGHVDHGKTSLLDAIRKTNVAAGEAGGITQHIGAYTVNSPKGKITFLDTPGHEAFTAMRARGAKVTDIVVIVVSAIDGVMPQTLESVSHAKAAKVPIIVAVNKMDIPDANPDRIKQTLAGHELAPEEWGGDTIYVPVSAKTGKGIDQLLENILLQAEILELKANYEANAKGTVVESKLDKSRGPVATVLIQQGTLKIGSLAVCGTSLGKVRAMTNSYAARVNQAEPGDPVEILGLAQVPNVGDEIYVVDDEKAAKSLIEGRTQKGKAALEMAKPKLTLEEMMAVPSTEKELRVILKADVQGSAEALKEALNKFPTDKAKIKILHSGTGGITESDVMLATASGAVVLGFNIRPDLKAQKLAESDGVKLLTYSIIYELLEDVKKLLEGLLDVTVKEKVIGRVEVRQVFQVPKIGAIAGSAVIDGKVTRGSFLRLLRDSRVIYEGKISSLRRLKDDVKEVAQGFECGIGLENFNDLKMGDQLEVFLKEEIKGTL